MNILVAISRCPDTTARIAFTDDQSAYDSNGVQYIMNPYDEWYALVRAIELKEAQGGKVVVAHVGLADADAILKKALAIGADEAVRINKTVHSSMDTAYQLSEYAKTNGFDAIFLGKSTIDYNGSEVGPMLAEYLGLPFIGQVNELAYDGTTFTAKREIEGGVEVTTCGHPVVIGATKGIAEQRIPNMRGIMMANRKPLQVIEAAAFDDLVTNVSFEKPPARSSCHYVDPENMDELVRLLHEEAKVI